MRTQSRLAAWIALGFIFFGNSAARAVASAPDTALAPSFNLPGRTATVSSDSLRGKFVYVDFWASWCVPCRKSFPWLRQLHQKYDSLGLAIVAINLDRKRSAAYKFLEQFPAPFLVAFDESGKTAEAFDVSAMPTSYLIDPSGRFVWAHVGFDPEEMDELEAQIRTGLPK